MTAATAEEITRWVGTVSAVVPLLLIPLSLALCIWLGSAKLPRTLIWLAGVTLDLASGDRVRVLGGIPRKFLVEH